MSCEDAAMEQLAEHLIAAARGDDVRRDPTAAVLQGIRGCLAVPQVCTDIYIHNTTVLDTRRLFIYLHIT